MALGPCNRVFEGQWGITSTNGTPIIIINDMVSIHLKTMAAGTFPVHFYLGIFIGNRNAFTPFFFAKLCSCSKATL